jgi:hypothetical protein
MAVVPWMENQLSAPERRGVDLTPFELGVLTALSPKWRDGYRRYLEDLEAGRVKGRGKGGVKGSGDEGGARGGAAAPRPRRGGGPPARAGPGAAEGRARARDEL